MTLAPVRELRPLSSEDASRLLCAGSEFVNTSRSNLQRQAIVIEAFRLFGLPDRHAEAEQVYEKMFQSSVQTLGQLILDVNRSPDLTHIMHPDAGICTPVFGIGFDTETGEFNALVGMTPKGPALWPLTSGEQLCLQPKS